ncbi:MAG: hypothetical protein WC761_00025 [Candidatus Paceibacterota bacterium]|jgi:hypothetical protein
MTWNYRVLIKHLPAPDNTVWYAIHEVYYNEAGEPTMCSSEAMEPCGETLEELAADLKRMAGALEKPVLDHAIFERKEASAV